MGSFRRGSLAKRAALSVIALYALLLQAFAAAAAEPAAPDPYGPICAQISSRVTASASSRAHRHGLCCISACFDCGCAFVAIPAGVAFAPNRRISSLAFGIAASFASRQPQGFYFAARGPPAAIAASLA